MSDALRPVEVFLLSANEDEAWHMMLQKHLNSLKIDGRILLWDTHQVVAGTDRTATLERYLNHASVILLLVSAALLASHDHEIQQSLLRQVSNGVLVIPILLHPVDWQSTPLARLQPLPRNNLPITMWPNSEAAFAEIVAGIRAALQEVKPLTIRHAPAPQSFLWNVPYPPNPFFIGQEALLTRLADTIKTQPQAISGLGGIGKTQMAVEYAYRHQQDYQAIFWVRADTHEALVSGFVALAELLNLLEKNERDQTVTMQAVMHWLRTNRGWLLILDNADDLSIVNSFLRSLLGGHILLTTRAHAVGPLAQHLEVETMGQNVGALFLLRRTGLIGLDAFLEVVSTSERALAQKITEELGGLPLALDQAAAYIEETGCGLAGYQQVYQQRRMVLLKRRGKFSNDYPSSVATTWTLSFEKIKQQNPSAADLLRCCALLHPDAIPEELFTNGARHLGSRLQRVARDALTFDDTARVLLAYSLIHRDPTTKTLSIHRLVQAVLLDAMPERQRLQWKARVVQAVNEVFPEVTFEEWTRCGRLLPHALACATRIEHEQISLPEAGDMLDKAGTYLRERAQYLEAESLLVRALSIREQQLGSEHPDTAKSLNSLAMLYRLQGKYEQAEPLYQRALSIREQKLGAEHPDTAKSLNGLAVLYRHQGKYEQAEPLYQRALSIREQQLGAEHLDTARSLNNLAELYRYQGKYEQAEPLYQRALSIKEKHLGAEHPSTALGLNTLASLYRHQGKYEQAESLYQRALSIREQHLGVDHPDTALSLNGLAHLYQQQGKYEQAESLYHCAHAAEKTLPQGRGITGVK